MLNFFKNIAKKFWPSVPLNPEGLPTALSTHGFKIAITDNPLSKMIRDNHPVGEIEKSIDKNPDTVRWKHLYKYPDGRYRLSTPLITLRRTKSLYDGRIREKITQLLLDRNPELAHIPLEILSNKNELSKSIPLLLFCRTAMVIRSSINSAYLVLSHSTPIEIDATITYYSNFTPTEDIKGLLKVLNYAKDIYSDSNRPEDRLQEIKRYAQSLETLAQAPTLEPAHAPSRVEPCINQSPIQYNLRRRKHPDGADATTKTPGPGLSPAQPSPQEKSMHSAKKGRLK